MVVWVCCISLGYNDSYNPSKRLLRVEVNMSDSIEFMVGPCVQLNGVGNK